MAQKMLDLAKKYEDGRSFIKPKKEAVTPNITWKHSWSLNETQDALLESPFVSIPNEIILYIFRYFSVPDLCNVSMVCRLFKMIADKDEIWKLKYDTPIKLHSKSYKHMYIEWIHQKSLRNKQLRSHYGHRTACVRFLKPSYPGRPTSKHQFEFIGGFYRHPNSSDQMTIILSVDIDKTTPELILLLEKASQFQQQWQHLPVLKQMIQRYYRFMQLKASHPTNILLIPTLDIEIIWQTHLLRPEMYQNDCLRLFRRVIDHSLINNDFEQFLKEQAFLDTCQLYEQRFAEKYCSLPFIEEKNKITLDSRHLRYESSNSILPIYSYWDKTNFEFSSNPPSDYENPFSFTEGDIITDGKWLDLCKQFMSQAIKKGPSRDRSLSRSKKIDLRPGALKRLKKSYERFLYMAAKYSLQDGNGFIPPTYAIDIIWHSHMQQPLDYAADCISLVGYVILHDPWPFIEDETMKKSCDETDQFWKNEFQCEIDIDRLYNTTGPI